MRRLALFGLPLALLALSGGCGDDPVEPTTSPTPELAVGTDPATGATVTTDKDDYYPGETVQIAGTSWAAGEAVHFHLTREPQTSNDNDWDVAADEQGAFQTSFPVATTDLGVTFMLTATGPASGSVVTTVFTDGNLQLQPNPTPDPFSPNADGTKDATTINWRLQGQGGENSVTIRIRQGTDIAGTQVRQFNLGNLAEGASGTVVWDGKNSVTPAAVVADGEYTIRLFSQAPQTEGNAANQRLYTALVDNKAPVITSPAVAPTSVIQGANTAVTVTGTATDSAATGVAASRYTIASAEYNIDGGTTSTTMAIGSSGSNVKSLSATIAGTAVQGLSAGPHLVCLRATDGVNNRSANNAANNANCATLTVTAANGAPLVDAGGPYSGNRNAAIALSGATATDPDGDNLTLAWTYAAASGVPAGTTCSFSSATALKPTITCTNVGTFKVTLTANDGKGHSVADDAQLVVSNSAPTARAGGPYNGNEGSAVTLAGSATDPDNDPLTYKWTYALGTGVDAGATCAFDDDTKKDAKVTCTDDGTFKLTLTVKDSDNETNSNDADLVLANVKPTANAGGGAAGYSGNEGSAIPLNGSADDPGNNDDAHLTYKWTATTTGIDAGGACTFDDDTKKDAKITCTDDGSFKVSLVATDDDGGASTASEATLTVANVAPAASAGGGPDGYSGKEGSAIQLGGSGDDPGNNDDSHLTYQWSVDFTGIDAGGACTFDDATKANPTISCTDDSQTGSFKVTLVVKDDDGGTSTGGDAALTVSNAAPVAEAGGGTSGYSGNEGSPVQLHGSATDVGANDTFTWAWEYTAGAGDLDPNATCTFSDIHAQEPTVTCTDDGTVKLTLTVTDDNGGQTSDDATLTLKNVDPVAEAGGGTTGYSGNEGAPIQLHGSATDVGTNDTFTWAWEYTAGAGDLDPNATCTFSDAHAKEPTVTCTDDGTVKLTLTVKDDDGGSDADDATLTLRNVDPVAEAGGGTNGYTGNEGSAVQLHGSATDAGSNDTFTWSWAYVGVNVDPGATCSFSDVHDNDPTVTCTDNGTIKLTLTATDDDGGSDTDDATLTLTNVNPVADAGTGPYSGGEGAAISLTGSASDAGKNDVLSPQWSYTAGAGVDQGATCSFSSATALSPTLSCTDDGTFEVKLTVQDDDGGSSTSTATVTVTNANPVASAGTSYTGAEGAAISLAGSASDPGKNDPLIQQWSYTAAAGVACTISSATVLNPTITCTDNGTIQVTLTVQDDDGGSGTSTATVTVANVAPKITGLTGPAGAPLPTSIVVGGTLNAQTSFTDPGTGDTHTAEIDCGTGNYSAVGTSSVASPFTASCTFSSIGPKTIRVKVTDDDKDSDEKSFVVTVKYNFDGFYAPVDRPNTVNLSKAGQAIPLKWRLTDANGAPITNLTAVTVKAAGLTCDLGGTVDQVEEYAAGASGLQNLGNGNYQFNWKTPTTYAGSCKSIALEFGGYTETPAAYFSFKK